jgi:hypothetical protein
MRALSFQRDFVCHRTGACCRAGWDIPVEASVHAAIASAVAAGGLEPGPDATASLDMSDPPPGAVAVVRRRPDGTCVFLQTGGANRCAVHHRLGHAALPSPCQQFPRVTLLDTRGVHVTLSHFCPTAAAMLARPDEPDISIVELPTGAIAGRRADGFDATATIPPFLRPGVAFDMESYDAWESRAVAAFGHPDRPADAVLNALAILAEDLRTWTPSRGALADEVRRLFDRLDSYVPPAGPSDGAVTRRLFDAVAGSVPTGLVPPAPPDGFARLDREYVAPVWPTLGRPVGRFLAAKLFAAHTAYLGHGIRTLMASVAAAHAVLRVEAVRQVVHGRHKCSPATIVEAARAADTLIEHLSDREALVRGWASVERMPRERFFSAFGFGA